MLIFQNPAFLASCARIFDLKFDGSLFVRKGIIASNICPLVPYGMIPDSIGLYAQVTLTTPPRYDVPERFADWSREAQYTNIVHTKTYAMNRNATRNLKKAVAAGVTVEPSEDIGAFHALFAQMFQHQAIAPPATEGQMKELFATVRGMHAGELLAAKTPEGRMVSGVILLWDDEMGHAWMNATDPEYLRLGTNFLVFREASEYIKAKGYDDLDLRMGNIERFNAFAAHFSPERAVYYRLKNSRSLLPLNLLRRSG